LEAKFLQKLKPYHPQMRLAEGRFNFFKHLECWKARERSPGALSMKFSLLLENSASVTNCPIWHKQSW
jgi:hypothetical protein